VLDSMKAETAPLTSAVGPSLDSRCLRGGTPSGMTVLVLWAQEYIAVTGHQPELSGVWASAQKNRQMKVRLACVACGSDEKGEPLSTNPGFAPQST
jgi:hypothetical protein